MDRERLTIPSVTSLTEDRIGHDLAPDTLEFMTGTFTPSAATVMVDVDAAYSFLGNARAGLLLYVGQPEMPGSRLYDSGGKPLPGVDWYSVASVNGESAWAQTTHRRLVLSVDPTRDVTWQLLGAIIGGSATVDVPAPRHIAITPDGTKAFVSSPSAGTVTPIVLGRPGYSYDQRWTPADRTEAPVPTDASPTHLSCDNEHLVVSKAVAATHHLSILSVADHRLLQHVTLPAGAPLGSVITPDGGRAIVGTATGIVAQVGLADGAVTVARTGGVIQAVAVVGDGSAAYAADAAGDLLHRLRLPDMTVEARLDLAYPPHVIRVAPDGRVWVLCRLAGSAPGRLLEIDPASDKVVSDHELPFPAPVDLAIVPVAGQSSPTVRTAWIVFDGGMYCQFLIGGPFAGQVHSYHNGTLGEHLDAAGGIALNDFGEIWVTQPDLDRVWKWPGGRLLCRADEARPDAGVFFGEYCEVSIYGASR